MNRPVIAHMFLSFTLPLRHGPLLPGIDTSHLPCSGARGTGAAASHRPASLLSLRHQQQRSRTCSSVGKVYRPAQMGAEADGREDAEVVGLAALHKKPPLFSQNPIR